MTRNVPAQVTNIVHISKLMQMRSVSRCTDAQADIRFGCSHIASILIIKGSCLKR